MKKYKSYFKRRAQNIRVSAKRRGLEYDFSSAQMRVLHMQFPSCPSCAVPFSVRYMYDIMGNRRPFMPNKPTVDRIDPSKGYVRGNLQLLCAPCNLKKRRDVKAFTPYSAWHEAARDLWRPDLVFDLIDSECMPMPQGMD
jgi:hypothetical protein